MTPLDTRAIRERDEMPPREAFRAWLESGREVPRKWIDALLPALEEAERDREMYRTASRNFEDAATIWQQRAEAAEAQLATMREALDEDTLIVLDDAKIDLDYNLAEAHRLHMAGEKSAGYFRHVLRRHNNYCKAVEILRAALPPSQQETSDAQ